MERLLCDRFAIETVRKLGTVPVSFLAEGSGQTHWRKRTGTSGRFTEAQACRYAQGLLVALDGFCGL